MIKMFWHTINWKAVHKDMAGIVPKGNDDFYLFGKHIKVNDAFVVIKGINGICIPYELLDWKIIPLYL